VSEWPVDKSENQKVIHRFDFSQQIGPPDGHGIGMNTTYLDIHLARHGQVTWYNHACLGYSRLARGVYGHQPSTAGHNPYDARRICFISHVQAIMAAYEHRPVLFGSTAFQILGVPLPSTLEDWDNCHVIVPTGTYRPVRKAVVAHRTSSPLNVWKTVNGFPLLHPVDHWLQLDATEDELVEAGDGLLRRRRSWLTHDEFLRRLGELDGTPGVKKARRAARWVVPGTDSMPETSTRLVLMRAGLPQPAVNIPVFCRSAGRIYHVDLGYEDEKLAIEYDGVVHVGDRDQMEIDAERRRDLQDEGWMIITVTAKQLNNPIPLIRSVEAALVLRHSMRTR